MKITAIDPIGVTEDRMKEMEKIFREQGHDFEYYQERQTDQQALKERIGHSEVIILTNQPLSGDIIRSAPNLQKIAVAFTGYDHIDLPACHELGITVSNAAGFSDQAVAELTVGLALDVLRKITENDARTRRGEVRHGQGRELAGKTIGIIGTGRIGLRTAQLFRAFGCNCIGYSRTKRDAAIEKGIGYVSLDELMKKADIISVHTPLTEQTKGLVGEKAIRLMKKTAILINTARGPVVDTKALAEALNQNKIAGAGIDVYANEPPLNENHPLLKTPNTVTVPHIGFSTREGILLRSEIVVENIQAWMKGQPVRVVS